MLVIWGYDIEVLDKELNLIFFLLNVWFVGFCVFVYVVIILIFGVVIFGWKKCIYI